MAKNVKVVVTCDINENDDTHDVAVAHFGFGGQSYELDLCEDHLAELEESFRPYVTLGRKSSTQRTRRASTGTRRRQHPAKPAATEGGPAAMRAWARQNGLAVSDRGRVSGAVQEAYAAAAAA
ncbi:MAG: histone-like nucleoid-structuring protein Lsr2 [Acidimicrobiales bacterium]